MSEIEVPSSLRRRLEFAVPTVLLVGLWAYAFAWQFNAGVLTVFDLRPSDVGVTASTLLGQVAMPIIVSALVPIVGVALLLGRSWPEPQSAPQPVATLDIEKSEGEAEQEVQQSVADSSADDSSADDSSADGPLIDESLGIHTHQLVWMTTLLVGLVVFVALAGRGVFSASLSEGRIAGIDIPGLDSIGELVQRGGWGEVAGFVMIMLLSWLLFSLLALVAAVLVLFNSRLRDARPLGTFSPSTWPAAFGVMAVLLIMPVAFARGLGEAVGHAALDGRNSHSALVDRFLAVPLTPVTVLRTDAGSAPPGQEARMLLVATHDGQYFLATPDGLSLQAPISSFSVVHDMAADDIDCSAPRNHDKSACLPPSVDGPPGAGGADMQPGPRLQ